MRILSFSYCFPNSTNPTWGIFVLQRLAALAKIPGVELQVVAPVPVFPLVSRLRAPLPPEQETIAGLTIHHPRYFYFPGIFKNFDARFYARGLKQWVSSFCRQYCPDLLDAHFVWPDGVGVYHLAQSLGIPYVISLRGWIWVCLNRPPMKRQCIPALQNAAGVISVSSDMSQAVRQLGVSSQRLQVIPNGVDTQMFHPRDKADSRRTLGLPTDGRLVISVAHLGPRKGHWEVVRALSHLPQDVRLVIVGSDIQGGKNERALRAFIDKLNMNDRVILPGRQPYEKIPLYFSAADVSVLASYREGCPNVVTESLACGTPVIATKVGAVSDMLAVPQNGRIVPPCNVEALTTAFQEVLDSQWSPEKISSAKSVIPWHKVAKNIQNVFTGILNEPTSTKQK